MLSAMPAEYFELPGDARSQGLASTDYSCATRVSTLAADRVHVHIPALPSWSVGLGQMGEGSRDASVARGCAG
jgi:hypothetical protein